MKKYFNIFILLFGAYIISSCGTSGNKEVKTELKDEGPTNEFYEVTADLQTQAVRDTADAADDPAIWIHPDNPEKSLIVGTNKQRGLAVYDLKGKEVFFKEVGRVNNVDIRYNFPLGDESIDIVAASNRTNNTILIMKINEHGTLQHISQYPINSDVDEVYGFCLYHDQSRNLYYAIVNSKSGQVEQWLLQTNENNEIFADKVRSFEVGGQTEGCVADDELGILYIGQENKGIWRYSADPASGDDRKLVDDFSNPMLEEDIEGLTIYYAENGEGYLIASSQGNNSYAVYTRSGNNDYLGSFRIIDAEGGIDGSEDTDGIDVINLALGPDFHYGFFIVQDGFNYDNGQLFTQNFKLVGWEKIAELFDPPLIIENTYNIRD
jgi:3-phytase